MRQATSTASTCCAATYGIRGIIPYQDKLYTHHLPCLGTQIERCLLVGEDAWRSAATVYVVFY
jgi:hypothetical protein